MSERDILFVIGSLDHGGAEGHVRLIAPRLRARGWRPSVFCLTHEGAQAHLLEADGVEVAGPPFALSGKPGLAPLRALKMLAAGVKLLAIMLRRRPRIVHFFLPGAYVVGGPLSLLARIPVRVMSRRSLDDYQARWPVLRRVEIWLHRRMTLILGNSARVVAQLVEREGCTPEKVELIYNGIETERFADAGRRAETRAGLGLAADEHVMVIVANLIAYKGHAELISGLARVRAALPPNWRLLAIGRDDGHGTELRRLTEELGLSEHVRFLGLRTDVPDLLAAADTGVLASHQEGFSNAVIECMAAGLPMVVTDVGGNAEAVRNGETGIVVPPRDPDALGRALQSLAVDPEGAREMGRAGQRRARELYSLESCVARYDDIYRSLLEGERPA